MAVHIVTYDLRKPGKNYDDLLAAIRRYNHCHALKSAFFIDTQETEAQVRDKLMKVIDAGDQLYVIRFRKEWAASRKEPCTDWLLAARNW